jgi:urea-proton symporter
MRIAKKHEGSYLTFKSDNGLVFAVDLLVAGFSTVWLDQAYWQRAIASRPESSVKAYLLGGIAWYGIPFGFATAMGLGCAALTSSPSFPTHPDPLSAAQNGAGLSSPATAIALLGKGGAGLMLLLLFMAVTSSTSAELIAVSSLLTFDIYKTYLKPSATSMQLVRISHYGVILYGLVLATFCCILNAVSVNLTWLLTVLGIIVGGASVPAGLVLHWKRMSTVATIVSPWIGFSFGRVAWFVTTSKRSGSISVTTTGNATNAVAGNVTSWGTGAVCALLLSLAFPRKFTSDDPNHVARSNKINSIAPSTEHTGTTASPSGSEPIKEPASEKAQQSGSSSVPTGNEVVDFLETKQILHMDPADVKKGERIATIANVIFLAIAILLVPFTLFGTSTYSASASSRAGGCELHLGVGQHNNLYCSTYYGERGGIEGYWGWGFEGFRCSKEAEGEDWGGSRLARRDRRK